MYQICNDEDELEPRVTPKPVSKMDYFAIPLVPEVSLIFDKSSTLKTAEYKSLQSQSSESKGLMHKSKVSSPLNANGSYAAWKEQNYSWRHPTSKINNCIIPQNSGNYTTKCYATENTTKDTLKEPRERNNMSKRGVYNNKEYKEQQKCSSSGNNSYKYNYETCEGSTTSIEKKQNIKSQCHDAVKHIDIASTTLPNGKVYTNSNNYTVNERECSPSLFERKLITHNIEQQRVSLDDSVNEPFVQNLTINPNTLKRNEFQLPHSLGQQYPYYNMNTYPFPQLHSYPTHNTDNQETVKNLLQIINSQNEQIKSLQTQVDRLLKMQEESFKERKSCTCLSQLQQQNDRLFINSNNDIVGTSSYVKESQNSRRNTQQNESQKDRRRENSTENENANHNELIVAETQPRKAFMEQKVSIGVMTSFEFTVQNNPFKVDIEDYEKKDNQQRKENLKIYNNVGVCDTSDSLRRYKSSFNRIPSAPLENIVEDSESYMSSSQQQSSNLNASISIKDQEKQACADIRKEIDIYKSESPKICKNVTTKLNQIENSTQKRSERVNKKEVKNYEILKTAASQNNAEYIKVSENNNYNINIPIHTDQCTNLNMQKDNDSLSSSTDYCKNYQKERQTTVSKRASCVEDSLILNGGDLKINERPPTPEPSIHVEMHEYSSDDDSEKVKRSSKVGWTFYNNVLGQVNQLLQNSCVVDDHQQNQKKEDQNERDETDNRAVLDTVKVATLEQLKKLGISLTENPELKEMDSSNKMGFDLSFYPRLDYQANVTHATSAVNETNTSMHMKALALKYLTDEQLAELAIQRQGSTSVKHLMVSNVQGTNMSFATMRYLERYQLLQGKNNVQAEDIDKVHIEASPKTDLGLGNSKTSPTLQRFPFTQTPRTTCPSKILDISTLKQQPKLL